MKSTRRQRSKRNIITINLDLKINLIFTCSNQFTIASPGLEIADPCFISILNWIETFPHTLVFGRQILQEIL